MIQIIDNRKMEILISDAIYGVEPMHMYFTTALAEIFIPILGWSPCTDDDSHVRSLKATSSQIDGN